MFKSGHLIGDCAFKNCYGWTSVTMLGKRPDVGSNAFEGCGKLKEIHVSANAKSWVGMKEWQGVPLVFDAKADGCGGQGPHHGSQCH